MSWDDHWTKHHENAMAQRQLLKRAVILAEGKRRREEPSPRVEFASDGVYLVYPDRKEWLTFRDYIEWQTIQLKKRVTKEKKQDKISAKEWARMAREHTGGDDDARQETEWEREAREHAGRDDDSD